MENGNSKEGYIPSWAECSVFSAWKALYLAARIVPVQRSTAWSKADKSCEGKRDLFGDRGSKFVWHLEQPAQRWGWFMPDCVSLFSRKLKPAPCRDFGWAVGRECASANQTAILTVLTSARQQSYCITIKLMQGFEFSPLSNQQWTNNCYFSCAMCWLRCPNGVTRSKERPASLGSPKFQKIIESHTWLWGSVPESSFRLQKCLCESSSDGS